MKITNAFSFLIFTCATLFSQNQPHLQWIESFPIAPELTPPVKNAQSLTIGFSGELYIADTGNHRLIKLNSKGEYLQHIGGFGWKANQFDTPVDIVTADGLNLYVADYNNQRIQRYGKNFEFISSLGDSKIDRLSSDQTGKTAVQISYPSGVAVTSLGDLFFTESEKGTVYKINRFGSVDAVFGGFTSSTGGLHKPSKLCATKKRVYVVDEIKIVVYDYFGNYLQTIGEGFLKKITDVTVGVDNRIYISDSERKTILIFDEKGEWISSPMNVEFQSPAAVEIWNEKLFVLDGKTSTIHIFKINGKSE